VLSGGARFRFVGLGLGLHHLKGAVDGVGHGSAGAVQLLAGAADYLAKQEAVGDLQGSGEYQTRAHGNLVEQKLAASAKGLEESISGEVATPQYYVSFAGNGN